MMYTSVKIVFLALFFAACGWYSKMEYQDVKTDQCCPYEANNGQCVDTCKCGYCMEGDYQNLKP